MRRSLIVILFTCASIAQNYQPTPANVQSRQWFQNNKFGLFTNDTGAA